MSGDQLIRRDLEDPGAAPHAHHQRDVGNPPQDDEGRDHDELERRERVHREEEGRTILRIAPAQRHRDHGECGQARMEHDPSRMLTKHRSRATRLHRARTVRISIHRAEVASRSPYYGGQARRVDLPAALAARLGERQSDQAAEAALAGREPSAWVFPSPTDPAKSLDAEHLRFIADCASSEPRATSACVQGVALPRSA